jgi:hypothetical protein
VQRSPLVDGAVDALLVSAGEVADEADEAAVVVVPGAAAVVELFELQPTAARLMPTVRTSVRPVRVLKRAVMQVTSLLSCAVVKWRVRRLLAVFRWRRRSSISHCFRGDFAT